MQRQRANLNTLQIHLHVHLHYIDVTLIFVPQFNNQDLCGVRGQEGREEKERKA